MLARSGHVDEARATFDEARRLFDDLGQPVHVAYLAISTAAVEPLVSDPPAAERELREAFRFFDQIDGKAILATVAPMLAATLVPQGRLDEAVELAELSRSIAAEDDLDAQVKWRSAKALALAERGEAEAAEALAGEALSRVETSDTVILHADALSALGAVLLRSGRPSDAAPAMKQAMRLYGAKGDVVAAGKLGAVIDSLSDARTGPE
jgi:tetratricopeptide (TPR) repeat protein